LDWVYEKKLQAKAAGEKSAEVRRTKTGSAQPKSRTNSERTSNEPRTEVNEPEPSVSGSFSDSDSKNKESIGETAIAVSPQPNLPGIRKKKEPNPSIGRFIGCYVKAFQEKYPPKENGPPPRPSLGGKVQGQIIRFVQEVDIDRACALIQVYCQMDDPWFKTKCHDFTTFLENQNKVSLALDRGEDGSEPGSHIDWSKFT
jgi:hypothetical protein